MTDGGELRGYTDLRTCPIREVPFRSTKRQKNGTFDGLLARIHACYVKGEALGIPCERRATLKTLRSGLCRRSAMLQMRVTTQYDPLEKVLWVWKLERTIRRKPL